MDLNVYGLQLDSFWEDKEANFAKARALLKKRRPETGSLIVLPEMFATGFSCNLQVTAEAEDGPTRAFLQELADAYDCAVIGGRVIHAADGKGHNQALVVAPQNQTLACYTKNQPFSLGGESEVHAPGQGTQQFEWHGLHIAPLVCYDLRFPELAREAVRQGAEVLVYIAAWPVKRFQHWLTLLQARAIENQAYVIGVNRCGAEPQFTYSGRSVVVDPHGIIIADAGEQERVLHAILEPGVVRGWRSQFPALRDAGLMQW